MCFQTRKHGPRDGDLPRVTHEFKREDTRYKKCGLQFGHVKDICLKTSGDTL